MNAKESKRKINRRAGWRDGHNREPKNIPTRLVGRMKKGGNLFLDEGPVPRDEEAAYHKGYEEGRNAPPNAINPYI